MESLGHALTCLTEQLTRSSPNFVQSCRWMDTPHELENGERLLTDVRGRFWAYKILGSDDDMRELRDYQPDADTIEGVREFVGAAAHHIKLLRLEGHKLTWPKQLQSVGSER